MVRVLASRPKVCKYKSARGYGLLKVIKIHSTPSFRGEVRLDAPCCKILQQVKTPLASMNKNTLQDQIFILLSHSLCLLPDVSAGRIAREFGGQIRSFP
jgi:hypothetical protein